MHNSTKWTASLGNLCVAPEMKITQMLAVMQAAEHSQQGDTGNNTDATEV
jgi:hypothetical protein